MKLAIAIVTCVASLVVPLGAAGAGGSTAGPQGVLGFYDWEASLRGRELAIGGHPGHRPPAAAVAAAMAEWRSAGRDPARPYRSLVLAGAYPTRDAAVAAAPDGATVVAEEPRNRYGEPLPGGMPGWFALVGEPALTNRDIVRPRAESEETGAPVVTFGFTSAGRRTFERVTRKIARRGRAGAPKAGRFDVEKFSHHFAVVVDGEVRTRPIINFKENPDGIDGRTGAQISGGFRSMAEARELVASLR